MTHIHTHTHTHTHTVNCVLCDSASYPTYGERYKHTVNRVLCVCLPHLVDLVVAVLEEVPEEREHLFGALVVYVSHTGYTLYNGLSVTHGQR